MPGLKGIQNGTEFFWPKWFQKIIGGSYIIAFHSEITAGSDKNKDAVIGLSSDPARSFHTCHSVHINIQEQDLKFSGLIIFKKFFCAEEMTDFCPDLFFLKIGNSDILQGFCIR